MQRFTLPRDLYHGKGALEALKTLEGDRCYLSYGTYHPRVGRGSLAAFYRQDRTDSACFLGL